MSDERDDRDDDLKRNEDPPQVAGSVIGAAGAGVGAGVGAALGGPLGAIIGALAGAGGGWWSGKGVHDAVSGADRADNKFRRAHDHAGAKRPYDEARHAYRLGYLAGRNPDHDGADFDEVERDLQTAWLKAHEQDAKPVAWEDVRDAARTGFGVARDETG
jgi:hypothetical protein